MNKIQIDESQNIEYKESWNDKYLEWICGFANAQGGKIYIGVNDDHEIVGVSKSKQLMEDIPNKIVTHLGIVADVNLLTDEGLDYIEIVVAPSNMPISYHGQYHYRSGSTKQELRGLALQQFILKKLNVSWDATPCASATIEDIDEKAVAFFVKRAVKQKRIPESCLEESAEQILKRLHLITNDGQMTMAAMLLFGKDIEQWCPTAIFRIGRFGVSASDLIHNDDIICPLIMMPNTIMETLRSRYLVSPIQYEGLEHVEPLEIPADGLREMLCNSIIHKDFQGTYIQMKVWNDHITLWNPGTLHLDFTIDTLMADHESIPRNKLIARAFYLAGYIEEWGRGYEKIRENFESEHLEMPTFSVVRGGFMANVKREVFCSIHNNIGNDQKDDQKDGQKELTDRQRLIVSIIKENPQATFEEMTKKTGLSQSTIQREIKSLTKIGIKIEREGGRKNGYWVLQM